MKQNIKKGFSLIEIIVTVAILAIFTAFLVPSYIHSMQESRAKKDIIKLESICTAFKTALGEPEVKKEVETNGTSSLIVISKVDENGFVDFSKSEIVGLPSSDITKSVLWANTYQSIGDSYEAESIDLINQYIIFYLKPKTESAVASCEYVISDTRPSLKNCTLKLGSYSDQESANVLVRRLAKDGFSAKVELVDSAYTVYVGNYKSIQDAKTIAQKLSNSGYVSAIVLLD